MSKNITDSENSEIVYLCEQFLGVVRNHYPHKGEVMFDCPVCSANKGVEFDGKGNLELNYHKGVYHCWSCEMEYGTKGKLYGLFKNHGNSSILKQFIDGKFIFSDDYYDYTQHVDLDLILELPPEHHILNPDKKRELLWPAFKYLYDRNINDEIIKKYNIGYCIGGKYDNRIIVPSYDKDEKLNFFVSRAIRKETKIKYLNPAADKTQIIFNENKIDWNKTVYLVEGVFDHVVVPNSIPLLGKKLYDKLFDELYYNAKSYIVIALDGDAQYDAIKIFNKLNAGRLRKRVFINFMPEEHDISSFNQIYGWNKLKEWLKTKNVIYND